MLVRAPPPDWLRSVGRSVRTFAFQECNRKYERNTIQRPPPFFVVVVSNGKD